ncbi:MAG TPA: hypothetical protein VFC46_01150 [Humisphaera sp.]|nr:hypothetical protein [Humisphaera sp.]
MELLTWIEIFAACSLFWTWILFWGGADWLEGSFLSGVLLWFRAPEWSSEGIQLFAACSWVFQAIWFIIGLFIPSLRLLLP